MIRILLILIPLITLFIPPRFFAYFATLVIAMAIYGILIFVVLNAQAEAAYAQFGIAAVLGYIGFNVALVGIRYYFIRRARARILKLPAPKPKNEQ